MGMEVEMGMGLEMEGGVGVAVWIGGGRRVRREVRLAEGMRL